MSCGQLIFDEQFAGHEQDRVLADLEATDLNLIAVP